VAGATHIGPGHTENQDRWRTQAGEGYVAIVVCDGAGSAKRSATGAQLASENALSIVDSYLTGKPGDIVGSLEAALEAATAVLEGDGELACTMSLVVIGVDVVAALNVGDSPIFIVMDDKIDHLESEKLSEFVNETTFLTSENQLARYSAYDTQDVRAVVVSSDGLTELVLSGGEPHEGFFAPLLAHARAEDLDLEAVLTHLSELERLGDDTTVVVAAKR
jgi:hypothetical protein